MSQSPTAADETHALGRSQRSRVAIGGGLLLLGALAGYLAGSGSDSTGRVATERPGSERAPYEQSNAKELDRLRAALAVERQRSADLEARLNELKNGTRQEPSVPSQTVDFETLRARAVAAAGMTVRLEGESPAEAARRAQEDCHVFRAIATGLPQEDFDPFLREYARLKAESLAERQKIHLDQPARQRLEELTFEYWARYREWRAERHAKSLATATNRIELQQAVASDRAKVATLAIEIANDLVVEYFRFDDRRERIAQGIGTHLNQ